MDAENGSAMTQSAYIGESARRRYHRRVSPPDKAYDVVAWRHHIIKEMESVGFGPSFISVVLRLDHSGVLHHMNGECKCINIAATLTPRTELSTGLQ